MTNGDAIEEINTLASSKNRVDILRLLIDQGEVEKRELKAQFDVSRPTLQRNLDTLGDAGWVRETLDGFEITVAGRMIMHPFADLVGSVETAAKLQPLLRWIPDDDFDLDPRHLVDAEVVVSEPSNPYAPVNRFVESLQRAEEFRAFMAVIARDATEIVNRRIADDEMTIELILTREAFETMITDSSFAALTADLLDRSGFTVLVHDGRIPFFLGLLDDEVHIGVEDDDGVPKALGVSENDATKRWADETFERYRELAEPVV